MTNQTVESFIVNGLDDAPAWVPYPSQPADYSKMTPSMRLMQDRWWLAKGRRHSLPSMGPVYRANAMKWMEAHAQDLHAGWLAQWNCWEWVSLALSGLSPESVLADHKERDSGWHRMKTAMAEADPVEWVRTTPLYQEMQRLNEELLVPMVVLECDRCDLFRGMEPIRFVDDPDEWDEESAQPVAIDHMERAHPDVHQMEVKVIGDLPMQSTYIKNYDPERQFKNPERKFRVVSP